MKIKVQFVRYLIFESHSSDELGWWSTKIWYIELGMTINFLTNRKFEEL